MYIFGPDYPTDLLLLDISALDEGLNDRRVFVVEVVEFVLLPVDVLPGDGERVRVNCRREATAQVFSQHL